MKPVTTPATAAGYGRTLPIPAATPQSAGRARTWTRSQLAELELPGHVVDAAELIVSELVANVALHVGGEAEATLGLDGDTLTITCADRGPLPAISLQPGADDEHHRGLLIVDALCGQKRFTRQRVGGGKRIFVLLETGPEPGPL